MDVGKLLHDQRWLIKAQGRFQTYVEAGAGRFGRFGLVFFGKKHGLDSFRLGCWFDTGAALLCWIQAPRKGPMLCSAAWFLKLLTKMV